MSCSGKEDIQILVLLLLLVLLMLLLLILLVVLLLCMVLVLVQTSLCCSLGLPSAAMLIASLGSQACKGRLGACLKRQGGAEGGTLGWCFSMGHCGIDEDGLRITTAAQSIWASLRRQASYIWDDSAGTTRFRASGLFFTLRSGTLPC